MSQSQTVLAFDIGIRNLAWCILRKPTDSSGVEVLGWDNYDLLAGQSQSAPTDKTLCAGCSAKATYQTAGGVYCVRHCPVDKPAFRDLSGNLVKKLPSAPQLRQMLLSRGIKNAPKSKGDLMKKISELYAIPILKQKVKKAVETELSILHDAIRKFIMERKELFAQVQDICLENQPVLKNPTMKSVQILLFATLRDLLQPHPPKLRLVHAKKKVEGIQTGDAGYKERKQGSEERVKKFLESNKLRNGQNWRNHLASYSKKNDLTDAFCMCLDFLGIQ